MAIDIFSFLFAVKAISIYIAFLIVVYLIYALKIMRLPVVEIQYDDAHVFITAIKIISSRIKKIISSQ